MNVNKVIVIIIIIIIIIIVVVVVVVVVVVAIERSETACFLRGLIHIAVSVELSCRSHVAFRHFVP